MVRRVKIKSIKKIDNSSEHYVYDIGMANDNHHWFFANNLLVHNSIYFTAWPVVKDQVAAGELDWSKENVVTFYDNIADDVNQSFPEFMQQAFHCTPQLGSIIKGGRELVASKGLFITKKRYAVLIYELEGQRLDKDGKPGKVKAMGLDLKRSDTPKIMQDFLEEILQLTLAGADKKEIVDAITKFRQEFKKRPGWEKGTDRKSVV